MGKRWCPGCGRMRYAIRTTYPMKPLVEVPKFITRTPAKCIVIRCPDGHTMYRSPE